MDFMQNFIYVTDMIHRGGKNIPYYANRRLTDTGSICRFCVQEKSRLL